MSTHDRDSRIILRASHRAYLQFGHCHLTTSSLSFMIFCKKAFLQFGHRTSMTSGSSRLSSASFRFLLDASFAKPVRVIHPTNFSSSKTPRRVKRFSAILFAATLVEAFASILRSGKATSPSLTSSGRLFNGMKRRNSPRSVNMPIGLSPLKTATPETPSLFMILQASSTVVDTSTLTTFVVITSLTLANTHQWLFRDFSNSNFWRRGSILLFCKLRFG